MSTVFLWWLAAIASSLAGLVVVSGGDLDSPRSTGVLFYMVAGLVGGGVLLAASLIHGRAAGQGNLREGLSNVAVEKTSLVIALVLLTVVYSALINLAYFRHADLATRFVAQSIPIHATIFLIAGVFAPIAEEVFFRGFAWNVLRGNWSAIHTALVTSILWLAVHWIQGIGLIIVLLPVALLLALARHVGGSVRAPIAVHMAYNIVGLLMPWIVAAYR